MPETRIDIVRRCVAEERPLHVGVEWVRELAAEVDALTPPRPEPVACAAGEWHEGAPPHPWDKEWFLAQTTFGDYAVLFPLPDDYTYDYKTADNTFLKRDRIAKWAQLSDSEFVDFDPPEQYEEGEYPCPACSTPAPVAPEAADDIAMTDKECAELRAKIIELFDDMDRGRIRVAAYHQECNDAIRAAFTAALRPVEVERG